MYREVKKIKLHLNITTPKKCGCLIINKSTTNDTPHRFL